MFKKDTVYQYTFKCFEYAMYDLVGCIQMRNQKLKKDNKIYYDVALLPFEKDDICYEYMVTVISNDKIMNDIIDGYVDPKHFNIKYLGKEAA